MIPSSTIRNFFDSIPAQYDFLNTFFSFGLDRYWRRRLVGRAEDAASVLDVGVGTGKSLAAFLRRQKFDLAVGCDFSDKMLQYAARNLNRNGRIVNLVSCDFHELPFPSNSFDLVTGSFMLRSVQHMKTFLSETYRVLKPGGQALFLELTRPTSTWMKRFYRLYLNWYIPTIGKFCSGRKDAYQFLAESIQHFVEPADLKLDFETAGFRDVSWCSLTFGSATIFEGRK